MLQNSSRGWLGALVLVGALASTHCGGVPEVAGGDTDLHGSDASSGAGASSASSSGGSTDINTGDNVAGGGSSPGDAGAGPVSDLCGDGLVGDTEECDDGNAMAGDGCSGVCLVEPGYVCATAGKDCQLSNTVVCGDGDVGIGEACDDGNATNHDGCSSTCLIEEGWMCEAAGKPCTPSAAPAECGNGLAEFGEACDDGNTVDKDGCTACKVDLSYVCPNAGQPCIAAEYCGDGIVQVPLGEDCDDANNKPGDGCDPLCHTQAGYACNPNVGATGETCLKIWVCGNGKVDPHEACDDTASGGCSAD